MLNQVNNQSLIPSTDVIQLTLTLKMTTAQVVETSITVNNSPPQDYVHPDNHAQPTYTYSCSLQHDQLSAYQGCLPLTQSTQVEILRINIKRHATNYIQMNLTDKKD